LLFLFPFEHRAKVCYPWLFHPHHWHRAYPFANKIRVNQQGQGEAYGKQEKHIAKKIEIHAYGYFKVVF